MNLRNTLAIAAALGTSAAVFPAHAQSLDDLLGATKAPAIEVSVACGRLDKANCTVVLPNLASKLPTHVTLKPIESQGSVQSAFAVCKLPDKVPMAVVQADAARQIAATTECANKLEGVGQPLYPYLGYMVVRADTYSDTLSDMINRRGDKAVKIAAGGTGSGGQVTLEAIRLADTNFRTAISIEPDKGKTALDKVLDGAIDAFFVMDGPDSEFVREIKSAVGKDGRPLYKFVSVDPPSSFYYSDANRFQGYKLYAPATISLPGWFNDKATISVNAILVANPAWRQGAGSDAASALRKATEAAEALIRAGTKTPRAWAPQRLTN